MWKKFFAVVFVIIFCFSFMGIANAKTNRYSRKSSQKRPGLIRVPGGANIPSVGLAIDASYDSRLDGLVPGYKIISVALFNQSFNIVTLDPTSDKWWIKFADGKKKKAIFDLRSQAPEVWRKLPEKVKTLVAYPLFLPVGARQVIDLFVPESVNAANFNVIILKLRSLPSRIEVMASQ